MDYPAEVPVFTEASARIALDQAASQVGIAADYAELIRVGENALFKLSRQPEYMVGRVARTVDYLPDAEKEVAVAAWLAAESFPAARLSHHQPQPVVAAGHPVTFWRWIDGEPGTTAEAGRLGWLLQALHALTPPADLALPRLDPFERVERRIATAQISDTDKAYLADRCHHLRAGWAGLSFLMKPGPIHGDAHIKNLMLADGRIVLIDFERFAWGQPEWDLVKAATEHHTAKRLTVAEYAAFCDGYGLDIVAWSGFEVAREITAINTVTWLSQRVGDDPTVDAEFTKRMRTLRGLDTDPWLAY
ncbi:MAG: phosphotransferase family protein [Nocardioides sp.]